MDLNGGLRFGPDVHFIEPAIREKAIADPSVLANLYTHEVVQH